MNLRVPRTRDQVVVGEAGGLHEGVYHRGAHLPEPPPHHVLAYRLRLRRLHRDLVAELVRRRDGLPVHESPQVLVERPHFILDL